MPSRKPFRHAARRAFVLIQMAVTVMVLGAMTSMAVDVGIFYTAKLELQRSADAAALAAAAELENGGTVVTAQLTALSYAQANTVAGRAPAATDLVVDFGSWTNNAFVPNASPVQAVRVRVNRVAAAGNPLHLYFAELVGISGVDAAAVSIARVRTSGPSYNLVGINSASFGTIGVLGSINGRFVSNGNVSVGYPLGVGVSVSDDVRSYGGTVKKGSLACIAGVTTPLNDPLQYDSVVAPATNNNANIAAYLDASTSFTSAVGVTIPAGVYVVKDLNLLANVAVRLQGPVTFFVSGCFNVAASVNLLGAADFAATNFKVRVLPGGRVAFLANILVPLDMDLYAPDSDINIAVGIGAFRGRLIGKTLTIALPVVGTFTEDRTLGDALYDGHQLVLAK